MKRILLAATCGVILAVSEHMAQSPQVPAKFRRHAGEKVPNQYIVVLHDSAGNDAVVSGLSDALTRSHRGQRLYVYSRALNGFAARLSEADARRLSEDPRVAYVEEDGVTYASAFQSNPPNWGLDRIDQRSVTQNSLYNYYADGTGVNAYVLDTGIRVTHQSFEGRAHGGFSAVADGVPSDQDCHGHGTHVAGILGSAPYGVAKRVNLFSVKVLNCSGQGTWAEYIAGVDWIVANAVRPAVINASIGGGADSAVAEAIDAAVAAGIAFVGAAGNQGEDACNFVPGVAARAITVGNSTFDDQRSLDSNWGTCVDIFAPGSAIASASAISDTADEVRYGTSMSSPHVAGAAALYLQRFPTATPQRVEQEIKRGATSNLLSNIGTGSPNLLLFSPYLGDTVLPTVSPSSPVNGAQVTGTITLSATASDNVELQTVRFFVGSTQVGTDSFAPYTFSWNSTTVADGTYTLRAQAIDLAGNSRDGTVSVSVRNGVDTTLPTVVITSPLSDTTLSGVVTIRADATDDIAVARVEFMVDGVTVGTDASAPYATTWNTTVALDGAHTLVARAFDSSGNNRLSASVVVRVDNQSTQLPTGWTNRDVGAVGQTGSAGHEDGTFALQAGGVDIWSTSDAFHYAYRSWTGDGEIVARVASLSLPAGASFAMAGLMFRESLAADARHAAVLIGTNGKLKFRRRTTVAGTTLSDGPSEGSVRVPYWLKLARRGNVFTAYQSTDGHTWTQVGPAVTLGLPATLHVGVWALRNGGAAHVQALLTNVTVNTVTGPLPTGWTNRDVGVVGQPGSAGHEDGTFALQAGGVDIWSTSDAFHYAYRSWTGDGEIVSRVASLSLPTGASFAMAGLMFRESLAANARHAAVLIGTNGKLKFRRRTTVGGTTLSDGPSEDSVRVPYWLKLARRGNVFTAYRSTDGDTWTQVGPAVTLALPATLHVGVWALRSGATAYVQAMLTDVSITP